MFQLINGRVEIDPDLMAYTEFRTIWQRDNSKDKVDAYAFICYIFHFCNPKSPYDAYSEQVRKEKLIEDFFPEHLKKYELYADRDFLRAMDIYKDHLNLSTFRLALDAVKLTIEEISRTLRSSTAKLPSKLTNITRLNKAIEELKKMEATVNEDEIAQAKVKGDRRIKKRER